MGSVAADQRAHRVCAVAIVVNRVQRAKRGRVEPVPVMHGRAIGAVTTIFALQGGMLPVYAGVECGHDDAAAVKIESIPDLVGANLQDIPFDAARRD